MEKEKKLCCPEFNPEPWQEKTHFWQNKKFIRDEVRQLFHRPLNMKPVVFRMWAKIQKTGAAPEDKDFLMLAYDPSPWKSEIYMNVTREVPDTENVLFNGTFLTKVFDGPYNAVPEWIREMDRFLEVSGKKLIKYYFYFTTCPKCAKKCGHNYVVGFAEVK